MTTITQARWTEMLSSAVTQSDMELFIFPELLAAGAIANLMSPAIWRWREDPYFRGLEQLSPYQRILRVKQYIIDHYTFNLDLETWGLTNAEKERARFRDFVDFGAVEDSNALLGYEGDRYYYDIDIRRHFGLEKYTTDVLPYWKTETVEAMDAFARRPDHSVGAGECVSLAMLYYAALHIVAGVPLAEMYMMGTPLHSQNFILFGDGLLTNNRRIVTKNMWYNGTELAVKAQRALRHEQVTMVANVTGYAHVLYPHATMGQPDYELFCSALRQYMEPELTPDLFYAFLRCHPRYQGLFRFRGHGKNEGLLAAAEALYRLDEHENLKIAVRTYNKLLPRLAPAERMTADDPARAGLEALESKTFRKLRRDNGSDWPAVFGELFPALDEAACGGLAEAFYDFCHVVPRLPAPAAFAAGPSPLSSLDGCASREEVVALVHSLQDREPLAQLALAAYRDLHYTPAEPFLRAAAQRNPVVCAALRSRSDEECIRLVRGLEEASIYDGDRLAQPDEVWNYGCGDGLEKAILLWNVLGCRYPNLEISLSLEPRRAVVAWQGNEQRFEGAKSVPLCRFALLGAALRPLTANE